MITLNSLFPQLAMSKPTVFVLGSSGPIGSATVKALSSKFSGKLNILAGTRDPASDKVAPLKSLPGVTVLQADMNDKEALPDLLTDVTSLFIVLPNNRIKLAIGAAEVAKLSGVKHILTVSMTTAELTDTIYGKLYSELESSIQHLEVPYTLIRLPRFVDSYWAFQHHIQHKSSFSTPGDPTKPLSAVVVEDAGKAAAAIMAEPEKHYGKTYKLISNCHTLNDLAAVFSEVLGKEVKYERMSYEDQRRLLIEVVGFSEEAAEGVLELYRLIDEESPVANQKDMSHFTKITGEEPTSLKEWVTRVAPAFK